MLGAVVALFILVAASLAFSFYLFAEMRERDPELYRLMGEPAGAFFFTSWKRLEVQIWLGLGTYKRDVRDPVLMRACNVQRVLETGAAVAGVWVCIALVLEFL